MCIFGAFLSKISDDQMVVFFLFIALSLWVLGTIGRMRKNREDREKWDEWDEWDEWDKWEIPHQALAIPSIPSSGALPINPIKLERLHLSPPQSAH